MSREPDRPWLQRYRDRQLTETTEDVMKATNFKLQGCKSFIARIWAYSSRHFGKSFWIMTMVCVSCTVNTSTSAVQSVTGSEEETKITFLPDSVDFGILVMGTTSDSKTVTIQNDGSTPLLIDDLSVSIGFSIAANSCPQPPNVLAGQGTCTVEVVFVPSIPEDWVGISWSIMTRLVQ